MSRKTKDPGPGALPMASVSYLASGKYSDVLKLGKGRRSVAMKLSYYRDSTVNDAIHRLRRGDAEGARAVKNRDSIMVSRAFAKATNDMIHRGVSPHFVYVYCDIDAPNTAQRFKGLLKKRFRESSETMLKFNNVCFMELFDSSLAGWLTKGSGVTDDSLRAVLFGVLYTLAALQRTYPGFRHNDLSINNILVKKLSSPMRAKYSIDGNAYYVHAPALAALSDYDFTHVPNDPVLSNERILNGKYRVTAAHNETYDSHFFLKSVLKGLSHPLSHAKAPKTLAWLKSLRLRSEDRNDTRVIPGIEPASLLRHVYFQPLRAKVSFDKAYKMPTAKRARASRK